MSNMISTEHFKALVKLLNDFKKKCAGVTPEEYLSNLLSRNENAVTEFVLEMFVKYQKHIQIFTCIFEYFCSNFKVKNEDKLFVLALLYVLVFELNENTFEAVKLICTKFKETLLHNLLAFVAREEFLILITEVTCTVFNSNYTLNTVVRPLVAKFELIENLQQNCIKHFETKNRIPVKKLTVPHEFHFTKVKQPTKKIVSAPIPEESLQISFARKIPISTYQEDPQIRSQIENAHNLNRQKALDLLEQAQREAFNCSKTKERVVVDEPPKSRIKPVKMPNFKAVEVKGNVAVMMREAAVFVKNREQELKKLEQIVSGAFDSNAYEALEAKERERIQQETVQNIERKHLQGLLTREEAFKARQTLLESNKQKTFEIKSEKVKWYEELEQFRAEELSKINVLVKKAQNIEQAARQSEHKCLEQKQRNAQIVQDETRRLLEQTAREQEEELNRKVALLKELKALQCLKDLNRKEFDPTETANLGLLCEMSIVELQERLYLLKLEMQEELKAKRKAVADAKLQRQILLQDTKEFVEINRAASKEKRDKSNVVVKVEDTPEIIMLRNKVNELRNARKNIVQ